MLNQFQCAAFVAGGVLLAILSTPSLAQSDLCTPPTPRSAGFSSSEEVHRGFGKTVLGDAEPDVQSQAIPFFLPLQDNGEQLRLQEGGLGLTGQPLELGFADFEFWEFLSPLTDQRFIGLPLEGLKYSKPSQLEVRFVDGQTGTAYLHFAGCCGYEAVFEVDLVGDEPTTVDLADDMEGTFAVTLSQGPQGATVSVALGGQTVTLPMGSTQILDVLPEYIGRQPVVDIEAWRSWVDAFGVRHTEGERLWSFETAVFADSNCALAHLSRHQDFFQGLDRGVRGEKRNLCDPTDVSGIWLKDAGTPALSILQDARVVGLNYLSLDGHDNVQPYRFTPRGENNAWDVLDNGGHAAEERNAMMLLLEIPANRFDLGGTQKLLVTYGDGGREDQEGSLQQFVIDLRDTPGAGYDQDEWVDWLDLPAEDDLLVDVIEGDSTAGFVDPGIGVHPGHDVVISQVDALELETQGELFVANNIKVDMTGEPGSSFADFELKVAVPLTAPMYLDAGNAACQNPGDLAFPTNGREAHHQDYPYWGMANGIDAYGELYLRIERDSLRIDTTFNNLHRPLLLKNAPGIMEDSLHVSLLMGDILTAHPGAFEPGDSVDVYMAGFWETPTRRTTLVGEQPGIELCDFPNTRSDGQSGAQIASLLELEGAGENAHVQIEWNLTEHAANGGALRLQRRMKGWASGIPDGPWEYVGKPSLFGGAEWFTESRDSARVWSAREADILTMDTLLPSAIWECETVEYRVEHQICDYIYHSAAQSLPLTGPYQDNPWELNNEGIHVDRAQELNGVKVIWSSVLDPDDEIDQYVLERRQFDPLLGLDDEEGWTEIYSHETSKTFIDEAAIPGFMYEYRVITILNCESREDPGDRYQSFPSTPEVGFVSNFATALGQVTFSDEVTPSVGVTVQRSELTNTLFPRHAARLGASEQGEAASRFMEWTVPREEDYANEKAAVAIEDTMALYVSAWVNLEDDSQDTIRVASVNFHDEHGEERSMLTLALVDSAIGILRNGTFIGATSGACEEWTPHLQLQGWEALATALEVFPDSVSATFVTSGSECNRGSVGIRLDTAQVNRFKEGLSSIYFGAGPRDAIKCTDPLADNYTPLALGVALEGCEYAGAGCMDPVADRFDADAPQDGGIQLTTDERCSYLNSSMGDLVRIDWFSDEKTDPTQVGFPAIYRRVTVDGAYAGYVPVVDFETEVMAALDEFGEAYSFSMHTFSTTLPNGEYQVRVRTSDGLPAEDFFGNFSVHDHAKELVNCIQYLTSELAEGVYNFELTEERVLTHLGQVVGPVVWDAEALSLDSSVFHAPTLEFPSLATGSTPTQIHQVDLQIDSVEAFLTVEDVIITHETLLGMDLQMAVPVYVYAHHDGVEQDSSRFQVLDDKGQVLFEQPLLQEQENNGVPLTIRELALFPGEYQMRLLDDAGNGWGPDGALTLLGIPGADWTFTGGEDSTLEFTVPNGVFVEIQYLLYAEALMQGFESSVTCDGAQFSSVAAEFSTTDENGEGAVSMTTSVPAVMIEDPTYEFPYSVRQAAYLTGNALDGCAEVQFPADNGVCFGFAMLRMLGETSWYGCSQPDWITEDDNFVHGEGVDVVPVTFSFSGDFYAPTEASAVLIDANGAVVQSWEVGWFAHGVRDTTLNLAPGSYTLTLEDSYGDGWALPGFVGGATVFGGANASVEFADGHSTILDLVVGVPLQGAFPLATPEVVWGVQGHAEAGEDMENVPLGGAWTGARMSGLEVSNWDSEERLSMVLPIWGFPLAQPLWRLESGPYTFEAESSSGQLDFASDAFLRAYTDQCIVASFGESCERWMGQGDGCEGASPWAIETDGAVTAVAALGGDTFSDFSGSLEVRVSNSLPGSTVSGALDHVSVGLGAAGLDSLPAVLHDAAQCYSLVMGPEDGTEIVWGNHDEEEDLLMECWIKPQGQSGAVLSLAFGDDVVKLDTESGQWELAGSLVPDGESMGPVVSGGWYHIVVATGMDDASGQATASVEIRPQWFEDEDFNPDNDAKVWSRVLTSSLSGPVVLRLGKRDGEADGAGFACHRISWWSMELEAGMGESLMRIREFGEEAWDGLTAEGNVNDWEEGALLPGSEIELEGVLACWQPNNKGWFDNTMVDRNGGEHPTPTSAETSFKSIRRAPPKADGSMGSLPGCSRVGSACNFNPFANVSGSCNLNCADFTQSVASLTTTNMLLDELRIFQADASQCDSVVTTSDRLDRVMDWTSRYMGQYTPCMEPIALFDFDEGQGNRPFDKSKTIAGVVNGHDARIRGWDDDAKTVVLIDDSLATVEGWSSVPLDAPHITEKDTTDATGYYAVEGLRFRGSVGNSTLVKVSASKVDVLFGAEGDTLLNVHGFEPSEHQFGPSSAEAETAGLDFIDTSGVAVQVNIVYEGTTCPVEGAQIRTGRSASSAEVLTDVLGAPLMTDAFGQIEFTVPPGINFFQVFHESGTPDDDSDDHVFDPATRVDTVVDRGHIVDFVDVTKRRVVGRFVGGELSASMAWNQGKATSGTPELHFVTPAVLSNEVGACGEFSVKVDSSGQYDILLPPLDFRLKEVKWADGDWPAYADNVMTPDSLIQALMDDDVLADSSSATSLFEVWDVRQGKLEWNHQEEYPFSDVDSESALPSGTETWLRKDVVWLRNAKVIPYQKTVVAGENGPECGPAPLVVLDDEGISGKPLLQNVFLGDDRMTKSHGGNVYGVDLVDNWIGNEFGNPDDGERRTAPEFLCQLPVVTEVSTYCMAFRTESAYRYLEANNITETLIDSIASSGADGGQVRLDFLAPSSGSVVIPLQGGAGQGTFQAPALTFYSDKEFPLFEMTMNLEVPGGEIALDPWGSIRETHDLDQAQEVSIGESDYVPFDTVVWRAWHMGLDDDGDEGTVVSLNPVLDFVLRDPPGDASYAGISQGSSVNLSREIATDWEEGRGFSNALKTSPVLSSSNGFSVGFGYTKEFEVEVDVEISVGDYEYAMDYSATGHASSEWRESYSFNQTVQTSALPLSGKKGVNQDLFYGRQENTIQSILHEFGPRFLAEGSGSGSSKVILGCLSCDSPGKTGTFAMDWSESLAVSSLPASFFSKTQYAIETYDIPGLEARRDIYFANSGLYAWPDGSDGSIPYEDLDWQYPPGMKLANNDDERWELYHQSWLGMMRYHYSDFRDSLSTVFAGHQGRDFITSEDDDYSLSDAFVPGLDTALMARINAHYAAWQSDEGYPGDDMGPGYLFTPDSAGQVDSVYIYNEAIRQWRLMLAENELEKYAARQQLAEMNVGLSDLMTWSDEGTNLVDLQNFDLEGFGDFTDAASNAGTLLLSDSSLWNDAAFQPFLIEFSGGGNVFSSSIARNNTVQDVRQRQLGASANDAFGYSATVNKAGREVKTTSSARFLDIRRNASATSTDLTYEYVLSDADEADKYLIGVVPGRGLDGPIFVNIASISSCPEQPEEPLKYADLYPAVLNYSELVPLDSVCAAGIPSWVPSSATQQDMANYATALASGAAPYSPPDFGFYGFGSNQESATDYSVFPGTLVHSGEWDEDKNPLDKWLECSGRRGDGRKLLDCFPSLKRTIRALQETSSQVGATVGSVVGPVPGADQVTSIFNQALDAAVSIPISPARLDGLESIDALSELGIQNLLENTQSWLAVGDAMLVRVNSKLGLTANETAHITNAEKPWEWMRVKVNTIHRDTVRLGRRNTLGRSGLVLSGASAVGSSMFGPCWNLMQGQTMVDSTIAVLEFVVDSVSGEWASESYFEDAFHEVPNGDQEWVVSREQLFSEVVYQDELKGSHVQGRLDTLIVESGDSVVLKWNQPLSNGNVLYAHKADDPKQYFKFKVNLPEGEGDINADSLRVTKYYPGVAYETDADNLPNYQGGQDVSGNAGWLPDDSHEEWVILNGQHLSMNTMEHDINSLRKIGGTASWWSKTPIGGILNNTYVNLNEAAFYLGATALGINAAVQGNYVGAGIVAAGAAAFTAQSIIAEVERQKFLRRMEERFQNSITTIISQTPLPPENPPVSVPEVLCDEIGVDAYEDLPIGEPANGAYRDGVNVELRIRKIGEVSQYVDTMPVQYAEMDELLAFELEVYNRVEEPVESSGYYELLVDPNDMPVSVYATLSGTDPVVSVHQLPPYYENLVTATYPLVMEYNGLGGIQAASGQVRVIVRSECDDLKRDTVFIPFVFEPACTHLDIRPISASHLPDAGEDWFVVNSNMAGVSSTKGGNFPVQQDDALGLMLEVLDGHLPNLDPGEAPALSVRGCGYPSWAAWEGATWEPLFLDDKAANLKDAGYAFSWDAFTSIPRYESAVGEEGQDLLANGGWSDLSVRDSLKAIAGVSGNYYVAVPQMENGSYVRHEVYALNNNDTVMDTLPSSAFANVFLSSRTVIAQDKEVLPHVEAEAVPISDHWWTEIDVNDPALCADYEGNVEFRVELGCQVIPGLPASTITSNTFDLEHDGIAPGLFGAVLPVDGVLQADDELLVRFDEEMTPSVLDDTFELEYASVSPGEAGLEYAGDQVTRIFNAPWLEQVKEWRAQFWLDELPSGAAGTLFQFGASGDAGPFIKASLDCAGGPCVINVVTNANAPDPDEPASVELAAWSSATNSAKGTVVFKRDGDQLKVNFARDGLGLSSTNDLTLSEQWTFPMFGEHTLLVGNDATGTAPLPSSLLEFGVVVLDQGEVVNTDYVETDLASADGLAVFLDIDADGTVTEAVRNRDVINTAVPRRGGSQFGFNLDGRALPLSDLGTNLSGITMVDFWVKSNGFVGTVFSTAGACEPSSNTCRQLHIDSFGALSWHHDGMQVEVDVDLGDAWHHIAIHEDNTKRIRMTVDGTMVTGMPIMDDLILLGGGAAASFNADASSGDLQIDEVRVWTRTGIDPDFIASIRQTGNVGELGGLLAMARFETDTVQGVPNAFTYLLYEGDEVTEVVWPDFDPDNVGPNDGGLYPSGVPQLVPFASRKVIRGDWAEVSWNADHDELIIEPGSAIHGLEDEQVHLLGHRKGFSDVALNPMELDVVHDVVVDLSRLVWVGLGETLDVVAGEEADVELSIVNGGSRAEGFEVRGIPDWMQVVPTTGWIPSGGSATLQVHVAPRPIGHFEVNLALRGEFACWFDDQGTERCKPTFHPITIESKATPPSLDMDISGLSDVRSVIARVIKNGTAASMAEDDVVMAYVDGELRGMGTLDVAGPSGRMAVFPLYTDPEEANSPIEFEVWDSQTDQILSRMEVRWQGDTLPAFTVGECDDLTWAQPLDLLNSGQSELQVEFVPGWNWFGSNVIPMSLEGAPLTVQQVFGGLQEHLLQLKAHGEQSPFGSLGENGFVFTNPADTVFDPALRYEILLQESTPAEALEFSVKGQRIDLTDMELWPALTSGYTELPFHPAGPMGVQEAMLPLEYMQYETGNGLLPVLNEGDLLLSRYGGFAIHAGNGVWLGSLEQLEPGQGYRLRLHTADEPAPPDTLGLFGWPISAGAWSWLSAESVDAPVSVPPAAFGREDMMPMVLDVDPALFDHGIVQRIEATLGGQVIGRSVIRPGMLKPLHFMTLFGHREPLSTDSVSFSVFFQSGESMEATERIRFERGGQVGTLDVPFVLTRQGEGPEQLLVGEGRLSLMPNPFQHQLTVNLDGGGTMEQIRVEGTDGRLVHVESGLAARRHVIETESWSKGMYVVRVVTSEGEFTIKAVK